MGLREKMAELPLPTELEWLGELCIGGRGSGQMLWNPYWGWGIVLVPQEGTSKEKGLGMGGSWRGKKLEAAPSRAKGVAGGQRKALNGRDKGRRDPHLSAPIMGSQPLSKVPANLARDVLTQG